jgi:hypothetical protein
MMQRLAAGAMVTETVVPITVVKTALDVVAWVEVVVVVVVVLYVSGMTTVVVAVVIGE